MDPQQANALLTLIADLARIIYGAVPQPEPEPHLNGKVPQQEAAEVL